jgi:hypothetical protein
MRCQVPQRDGATAFRHSHAIRQIILCRVVKIHLSPNDHVGQKKGRDCFCHRSDLKDRFAIEGAIIVSTGAAVGNNPGPSGVDYTSHDANVGVRAFGE